jgi:hypothetical protein
MYKRVFFGQKSLRFWYYRYKDSPYYAIGVVAVLSTIAMCLLFLFVIPQFQTWFSVREEVTATQARVAALRSNTNFMSSLDRANLQKQLATAMNALPSEKNFDLILNSVSYAARSSGVSLGEFAFQVGDIASTSAAKGQVITDAKGLSSVKLTIGIVGSITQIQRFLQSLQKSVPLSEVEQIEGNKDTTTVTVVFYQKALPKLQIQPDQPLVPVSSADTALLNGDLSAWQLPVLPETSIPPGTGSAVPLF